MPTPFKSHDLRLPDWGPYSKRYAGVAHIPDIQRGLRFDLSVIPGRYRGQMLVPNEKWASGHHAWEAAPDLSYYAYRYEIEWKDRVYCDVSFSAVSDQARLVRCAFVNHSDAPQHLMLHLMANMNFPPVRPYSDEAIRSMTVTLPDGGVWVDALDYDDLQFATPRPTDNLVEDGLLRAEIRAHGLVNGTGIGTGFGREIGDWVDYRFTLPASLPDATLTLRYRLAGDTVARFRLEGLINTGLVLTANQPDTFGFSQVTVPIGEVERGASALRLTALGGASLDLDGFAITATEQANAIHFDEHVWTPVPEISAGPRSNSLILRYADTDMVYGLAWNHADFMLRELFSGELDSLLRLIVPDNVAHMHHGHGDGHFTNVWIRPFFLQPGATHTTYAFVCSGTAAQVKESLSVFALQSPALWESQHAAAHKKAIAPDCLPSGETYRFSQTRMAATELLNIVYPVYTQRQYIRHSTPGKWWDCLYTWDSGFIGLALLELDVQRAIDNLNAYLTEPGNPHAAFIHHGSPVPTQMYLFLELWNRTQDRTLLERFYPGLRQYYRFLAGHSGSSTTRKLKSNLLTTWDYFFESGGWDDYPAQVYMHENHLEAITACAAITAHVIRSARILRAAAAALGATDDMALYDADIATFADALRRFAWDEDAGYFSYVLHDTTGLPTGPLRHASGHNFNMGLDGVMPLIAGVCTPEQEAILLARLQDPKRFWTPIGLSTVDQSAPYYRQDGYWNGSVWMPQQWFIWKTALDMGLGDFAHRIAKTALDVWKAEVENSYYCCEHFIIGTGRGAGWHQFGGLSSPVVSWFSAYHRPGRLTGGFDVWIEEQHFADGNRSFRGQLRLNTTPRTVCVLATMQPGLDYTATWDGVPVVYQQLYPGVLQITIPFTAQTGQLIIKAD